MRVVIATMAARHLEPVMAIDAACYSAPWSPGTWRAELAVADRRHLVALADDKERVVGHAGTLQIADELHITTVAVHPDHQGQGIASRLVAELLLQGRSDGAAAAQLEVRASAHRIQRMYARFGFAPAGMKQGYYSKPTDDAVIMWLPELQSAETAALLDSVDSEIGMQGASRGR